MQSQTGNEPRKRKGTQSIQKQDSADFEQEPIHCQPVSPGDDLQARIINRAYALYTERGYRQGYALDDWLEAEREILGLECNA